MTMMQVNHPAVMAVTAFCIVNISLCIHLVKMLKGFEVVFLMLLI